MTAKPSTVLALARQAAFADGDNPSDISILSHARRVLRVGRGVHAGLHTCDGIVRVDVLDGDGFARGESMIVVRVVQGIDGEAIRETAADWLTDDEAAVVRVIEASRWDIMRERVRWAWWRRRLARLMRIEVEA